MLFKKFIRLCNKYRYTYTLSTIGGNALTIVRNDDLVGTVYNNDTVDNLLRKAIRSMEERKYD